MQLPGTLLNQARKIKNDKNRILKHFLYFLKVFLIFLEMKPYTFRPKLKTLKTSSPPKIAYITGNGTF